MAQSLWSKLRRFSRNTKGTVVVTFAVALIPVSGLVGASMDYSRAANVRSELQNALDASVLAVAHQRDLTDAQAREQLVYRVEALLAGAQGSSNLMIYVDQSVDDTLLAATATIDMKTSLLQVMGISHITVGAEASVSAEYRALEVALVLDNTGSMRRRMGTLRTAAQDFVDVVTEDGTSDQTSIALVPYVASVNIGNTELMEQFIDKDGESQHHADLLETRWLGKYDWCSYPNWGSGGDQNNGGGGNDGASLSEPSWEIPGFRLAVDSLYAPIIEALSGVSPAHASDSYTYGVWQECYITNPAQISHWQLFDQLDGVEWKGCVEARPEPFDVTDEPPDPDNPDSLWVPYFWIDDTDDFAWWVPDGSNDWIDDGPFLNNTDMSTNYWGRTHSVLKYASGASMSIDETPPSTRGPNMSCGDPIVPLTNDYEKLTSRITGMSHWFNGGTQTAQGVAWGWRALSPSPPFTEGLPYDEVTKVMVVMTDGENWLVSSDNEAVLSDYSAYGHLRWGRYPEENTNSARQYIDQRTLAACANAKDAGVIVYTVTFGLRNAQTRAVWDECATEEAMAYHVDTSSELVGAFNSIAEEVGDLRLTR